MIRFFSSLVQWWRSLLGAIIFYTVIPIPQIFRPSFIRIARWCPWIGLGLGALLSGTFWGLSYLGTPSLLTATSIVALWVSLTGGLHLDGAMDSADGLAVPDPQKRLVVMADSVSGAFGVMAGVLILLLKVAALEGFNAGSYWLILTIPAWGRWAQVMAIAFYPYLKAEGKGAFHRKHFKLYPDFWWSIFPLLILLGITYFVLPLAQWLIWLLSNFCSCFWAIAICHWFAKKFKGHTGDTYGATVEWTEVFSLISASLFANWL